MAITPIAEESETVEAVKSHRERTASKSLKALPARNAVTGTSRKKPSAANSCGNPRVSGKTPMREMKTAANAKAAHAVFPFPAKSPVFLSSHANKSYASPPRNKPALKMIEGGPRAFQ